jgi:hypothetical protein
MRKRAAEGRDGASDEAVDAKGIEAAVKAENRRRREDVWQRI